jgi:hypothetical protein
VEQIPAHTKLDAPGQLTVAADGAEIALSWQEVSGAETDHLYAAVGDEPDYTLLRKDISGSERAIPKSDFAGIRVTFRVTAVAADGTESRGITAVLVP